MTSTVDSEQLSSQQNRSQRAFHRTLASASPGAHLIERKGGIQATIVPATPDISAVNSVFYDDPEALEAALPDITAAYTAAGVARWAVLVPARDQQTARVLQTAGHTRRVAPMVMGRPLDQVKPPSRNIQIELDPDPTAAMVGHLNDIAFGIPAPHGLADALRGVDNRSIRAYVARHDGEIACGLLATHEANNLYTWGFASTPEATKSPIALRLMRIVVRDALDVGCTTTTCETTHTGQAVAEYFRLRPIGRLAMWEYRAR